MRNTTSNQNVGGVVHCLSTKSPIETEGQCWALCPAWSLRISQAAQKKRHTRGPARIEQARASGAGHAGLPIEQGVGNIGSGSWQGGRRAAQIPSAHGIGKVPFPDAFGE